MRGRDSSAGWHLRGVRRGRLRLAGERSPAATHSIYDVLLFLDCEVCRI